MKPSELLALARRDAETLGWMNYGTNMATGPASSCVLGRIGFRSGVLKNPERLPLHNRCVDYLKDVVGPSLPSWNDNPDRTLTDVLDAFDHAIKFAKEDEALA